MYNDTIWMYNGAYSLGSFAAAGAAGIMIEDQTWPKSKYITVPQAHSSVKFQILV